jgi:hypothetical protein
MNEPLRRKELHNKKRDAVAKDPPGSEGFVLTNKVYANGAYFCVNRSVSCIQDSSTETLFTVSGMVWIYPQVGE